MKATQPLDQLLAAGMTWIGNAPALLVRFIGISEAPSAIGLVVPAATRIAPKLTGIAAGALTVVMVLAVGTHLTHGEGVQAVPAALLAVLTAFVAWGRLVKAPIPARA